MREASLFEVNFKNRADEDDLIVNEVDLARPSTKYIVHHEDKITCNCGYFDTTGLICRHIFFICFCENIKDINKLVISQRWNVSLEMVEKHFINLPEKNQWNQKLAKRTKNSSMKTLFIWRFIKTKKSMKELRKKILN